MSSSPVLGRLRGKWCRCYGCADNPTRGQLRALDKRRWLRDWSLR